MKPKPSRNPQGRPKDIGKRAGILRAAIKLFMGEGYENTSMEAVAKKAGVSKLTIYSHFADKEELFREVIRHRCDAFSMSGSYMSLVDKPVTEALMLVSRTFATHVLSPDSLRLHRVMQTEAQRHPELIHSFYEVGPKRVKAAFAELLSAWNKQKKLSIPDPMKATEQFFTLVKGEMHMKLMLRVIPHPSPKEIEKHIEASVAMFLAAYQPKLKTRK